MTEKWPRGALADIGEFELIELLRDALGPQPSTVGLGSRIEVGIGDDCAALAPTPGALTVHTTDTMVWGVHFLPDLPPEKLGWKSLASNISDIASMGALPTIALVTLAVPSTLPLDWLLAWYRGMAACAKEYNTAIIGGDIVRTFSDTAITVSLAGEVEPENLIRRDGAMPGDVIIVTGTPGESAAGLALIESGQTKPAALLQAHLEPRPRLTEGRALALSHTVHAMMDVSDGPAGDLQRLCHSSGVDARVDAASLPLSHALREAAALLGHDPFQWALSGGEDYELMLCVPPEAADGALAAIASCGNVRGTIIGEILPLAEGINLCTPQGQLVPLRGGFTHF